MRILYLAPDYDIPSWGNGLLYHHVRLLREAGFDARLLHEKEPFRMSWIDMDLPIEYRRSGWRGKRFQPKPEDLLVVPEVQAHSDEVAAFSCRKVVFVQGGFLILNAFERAIDYRELGFEAALAVMPHIRDIVSRHFGLEPAVVPPFVADYFFVPEGTLGQTREKRILLAGKPIYREAGYVDFDVAHKVLSRAVERRAEWELVELAGLSHRDTAALMQRSALLINLNILESFNAIVPEAMAAGCPVFCFEAYGGRDFLRSGENAMVWPNNYVYPLLDEACGLIENYDERTADLDGLRRRGWETAKSFSQGRTADALIRFFRDLEREKEMGKTA